MATNRNKQPLIVRKLEERRRLGGSAHWIATSEARRLCGGKLPAIGREKLVQDDEGRWCWVSPTWENGQPVWSIRCAGGWQIDERGRTVLTSAGIAAVANLSN